MCQSIDVTVLLSHNPFFFFICALTVLLSPIFFFFFTVCAINFMVMFFVLIIVVVVLIIVLVIHEKLRDGPAPFLVRASRRRRHERDNREREPERALFGPRQRPRRHGGQGV